MRTLCIFLSVIIFTSLVLYSCEALDRASVIPEVTFKSFTLGEIDSMGIRIKTGELVFSFIDGDADFGVIPSATEDTLNLILLPYKKLNGVYDSIDANTYGRKYTVLNDDNLVRTGQNKTIKGEIKLQIYFFLTPPFDTIRYNFYILDRAGHKSNVASTSDIVF